MLQTILFKFSIVLKMGNVIYLIDNISKYVLINIILGNSPVKQARLFYKRIKCLPKHRISSPEQTVHKIIIPCLKGHIRVEFN